MIVIFINEYAIIFEAKKGIINIRIYVLLPFILYNYLKFYIYIKIIKWMNNLIFILILLIQD